MQRCPTWGLKSGLRGGGQTTASKRRAEANVTRSGRRYPVLRKVMHRRRGADTEEDEAEVGRGIDVDILSGTRCILY